MNFSLSTYKVPQTICVKIVTKSPQKICLQVSDYNNRSTVFTDRDMVINGEKTLEVMLPIAPEKCFLSVFNFRNGNVKGDTSFIVTPESITKKKLATRYDVVGLGNPKIRNFINFAQNFSLHASDLAPNVVGQYYKSEDGNFFIQYLAQINSSDGRELNTPARINKETGVIQVSKKFFKDLTVPERMAILLHEFSHFNLNENIDDESEADLNGLLMYLGLGFPRIEASSAWLEVFLGAQTEQNKERYKLIEQFIKDFENYKI